MRLLRPSLLLAGLLFAGLAWSAPRIAPVAAPPIVREGAEYETVVPALPVGVREFELFLRVEDGSGRTIRLSAEHEGNGGTIRWRMPRVGATRARLVLRAGGRFGETESEPSACFEVEPGPARGLPEVLRGEDELERHFGRDGAAEASLLPPGTPALLPGADPVQADAPPRDDLAPPPAPGARGNSTAAPSEHIPARTTPLDRRPAFVPRRN